MKILAKERTQKGRVTVTMGVECQKIEPLSKIMKNFRRRNCEHNYIFHPL